MTRPVGRARIRNFFRRMILVLVALFVGIRAYQWNAKNLVGNSLPMPFGYGMSVVLSGSMEPVLSVDDLVFIRSTQDVSPGDVIVYQSGSELIIHRVLTNDGTTIVTQGDANNVADEPFSVTAVKGKMIGHIPAVGGLIRLIKTPAGTILLLAAAIVLLELSYRKERSVDSREQEAIKEEIRRLKAEAEGAPADEGNTGMEV